MIELLFFFFEIILLYIFFLHLEFDIWYKDNYLNKDNTGTMGDLLTSNKTKTDYPIYDDAAERFERMQKELLLSDLDSMPFRQAQMRTNRRVYLEVFCLFFFRIISSFLG